MQAADWLSLDTKSGPGRSLQAPLFKAAGIRKGDPFRPVILDATAGYGMDTWLLACCGCQVIAVERHPRVFAHLQQSLQAAQRGDPQAAARIRLIQADTLDVLTRPESFDLPALDTIYLDPMFPSGRKTAEKKPMRLLRSCAGDDPDADRLLHPARLLAVRRVTVKRPRLAPFLDATAPDLQFKGRGFRFDVYLAAGKPKTPPPQGSGS